MNAAVVCELPGCRNQSLFFWLCCDMLNATFRAQVSFFFFFCEKLFVDWSEAGLHAALYWTCFFTFWLWHYGHTRGADSVCIASLCLSLSKGSYQLTGGQG